MRGELLVGEDGRGFVVGRADSWWQRLSGLMGRSGVPGGYEGLAFGRCSSLHTCFMRFPLDIVFVRDGVVTRIARDVRPWRFVWGGRGVDAIEFPAGAARRLGLEPGARLTAVPVTPASPASSR